MGKIDTDAIRNEWIDKPDSELKRASLKLCDDYEQAINTIKNKRIDLMGKKKHLAYADALAKEYWGDDYGSGIE